MKIENLAVMVKNGFDQTATKQELRELRKDTAGMFDLMMQEMRDVKIITWKRGFQVSSRLISVPFLSSPTLFLKHHG